MQRILQDVTLDFHVSTVHRVLNNTKREVLHVEYIVSAITDIKNVTTILNVRISVTSKDLRVPGV